MKLMIFVMEDSVSEASINALVEQGFRVTQLASTGGFLRKGNTTLLVGLEDSDIERASTLVKSAASNALAITLDLERYERM